MVLPFERASVLALVRTRSARTCIVARPNYVAAIRPQIGFSCTRRHLHCARRLTWHCQHTHSGRSRGFATELRGLGVARNQQHRDGVPVVLLSGFLGAGKTTLLENLLRADHGLRLGVIVNDLASVNVDAMVLDGAAKKAGAQKVELSNGCVCCSASGEFRTSIADLVEPATVDSEGSRPKALDAIIVELSGVAEPQQAKGALNDMAAAHVARTITVVDSSTFSADFVAQPPKSMQDGGHAAPTERVSALLAEQIECADLVLLNKADLSTPAGLQQTEALVRAIKNSRALELLITEHGRVEADVLLPQSLLERRPDSPTDRISPIREAAHDSGHGHGHSHSHDDHGHSHDCTSNTCSDPTHDHRSSAEKRFGIRSFVYVASKPFSRWKFVMEMQRWQAGWKAMGRTLVLEDKMPDENPTNDSDAAAAKSRLKDLPKSARSPLEPVLRSKGLVWTETDLNGAYYWSHAGRMLRLAHWGQWSENITDVIDDDKAGRLPERSEVGIARNEIVFIGADIDETAVRKLLDGCLLTDKEFEALKAKHEALSTPAV